MRNVGALRQKGFVIEISREASGCTDITFVSAFSYGNARFEGSAEEIFKNTRAVPERSDGTYQLTVAGEFANDTDVLPFFLISESAHLEAANLSTDLIIARQNFDDAKATFAEFIANQFTGSAF